MSWMKRGLFELLASLLLVSLLGTVFAASGDAAFGHSQKLKTWFSQSGIYDQVVTNSINNAQNSLSSGADTTAISLKDPAIQKIARSVYSPQLVQQNVETFIDSNYAWLEGKSAAPDFRIDLTQTKQMFAQKTGVSVKNYLTSLKVCTPEQLAQLQTNGTINPLSIACRPTTLDPQTEATQVSQQLTNGPFIEQPVITAQTIGSSYGTPGSQPYYQQYAHAPLAYQILKLLPTILGVLTVVIIAALFMLAENRRVAARRIGFVFLLSGLVLVLVKLIADFILNKVEHHVFTNQNAGQLQQPLTSIAHNIEHTLVGVDLIGGLVCLAVAIAVFIILQMTRQHGVTPPSTDDSSGDQAYRAPVETPVVAARPAQLTGTPQPQKPRRPRLIQ